MNQPRTSSCGVVIVALIFGLVGGVGGSYAYIRYCPEAKATLAPSSSSTGGIGGGRVDVTTDKDAIINACAKASPSVVKIVGAREPQNMQELIQGGGIVQGIGSGVIFEYNGKKLVLTNRHVVGGFTELDVKLVDGRTFKAKVLGSDAHKDLAVVEILQPPADLVAAPLGDASKLKIGEWVIAIGNPFDYEHTVSVGVVSARGARQVGQGELRNVIQTDAAINQGNSGGPLLDLGGNVVGINYQIYSPTGASVGIGFAIPINEAEELMYFLVNGGPWLGIASREVNSEGFARYLGIEAVKGVVVLGVYKGSPAEKAGLLPKDVITAVDGAAVSNLEEFQTAIFKHKIGDTIKLSIQRGATKSDVSVVAGKAPPGDGG